MLIEELSRRVSHRCSQLCKYFILGVNICVPFARHESYRVRALSMTSVTFGFKVREPNCQFVTERCLSIVNIYVI